MSLIRERSRIVFTQVQIEWLEKLYPEITTLADGPEMFHRAGQRSVLARIKQESNVEVRHVPLPR